MARGPQSRELNEMQIRALKAFRNARHEGAPCGYSLPQLRMAMSAPFGWRVLQKALLGRPVREMYYEFIANWIAGNLPGERTLFGKSAAAGETQDEAAPIRRGSR
jgi:hypothetical protein